MKKSEEVDEEIAEFSVQLTSAMTPFKVKVLVTGGVKDKQYDFKTPGLNIYDHRFVYSKVMVYNRQVWLDKNLGAYYADAMRFQDFGKDQTYAKRSPLGEIVDYRMLGSVFQWGRVADGHELVEWSSSIPNNNPSGNVGNFKYTSLSQFPSGTITDAWRRYTLSEYSTKVTSFTDPCPSGWHTPTKAELEQQLLLHVVGNLERGLVSANRGNFGLEIIRLGTASSSSDGYGNNHRVTYKSHQDYGRIWTSTLYNYNNVWALELLSQESSDPRYKIPQTFSRLSYHTTLDIAFAHPSTVVKASGLTTRCVKD